jgi:phosphoenolpyruvate-protein kinase (PTS system EI component)
VTIIGRGVSGGTAQGRLVAFADDLPATGLVILLDALDGRVAMLKDAAGVVALAGGITSHGAILAREFRIPAVVANQPSVIMPLLEHTVTLDGHTGTISTLEYD